MFDPRSIRKEISDAIARGVRSGHDLPLGLGQSGGEPDPEAARRLESVRRSIAEFFSRRHYQRQRPSESDKDAPPSRPKKPGWEGPYPRERRSGRLVPPETRMGGGWTLAIPQLHLYGPPKDRARRAGELLRPILEDLLDEFLRQAAPAAPARWGMDAFLTLLANRIPVDLRAEIRAFARAAGVPTSRALALTLMGDFHAALGCSTILIEPPLADPGTLLFGRNLDFIGYGLSDAAALLTVHHPPRDSREIPHASLGWAGLWGIHTGWNAAGLCLANMQVYNPKPDSPAGPIQFLAGRTPTSWAYAGLLRRCKTVRQALDAIDLIPPLSPTNLMLADVTGDAALVEWDIHRHRIRRPNDGRLFATNYFIEPAMRGEAVECWRMEVLDRSFATLDPPGKTTLGVPEVQKLLDAVNQGDLTLHSIVFEPASRRIHLTAAAPPSTQGRWDTIPWDVWEG